jgi:hypothetical protein
MRKSNSSDPAVFLSVAMSGCSDVTGPTSPAENRTVNGLVVLAGELHDAADLFVARSEDIERRGQVKSAVDHLAEAFAAGNVTESRSALAHARSVLTNMDQIAAIELAPVGLALDYIERRMNEILNSNAHDPTVHA